MSKETKARVSSAFRAMKAIGISEDKVKPVLKNLLKLYDKNWALIEEENYRALADAIFDRDEQAEERSKKVVNNEAAAEQSKKIVDSEEEAQVPEEPVQPLKRLRLRYRDGESSSKPSSSSLPKTSLVVPKEEPNEMAETYPPEINGSLAIAESPQPNAENITSPSTCKNRGKQPVSSKPLVIHENSDLSQPSSVSKNSKNNQSRTESRSQPYSLRLRERGASSVSPQKPSAGKRPAPESSSRTARRKEPKTEILIPLSSEKKDTAQALIVPKDEPITDNMPFLEAPDVIIHPDTSNGREPSGRRGTVRENSDIIPSALQSASEKETVDGPVVLAEPRNNGEQAMVSSESSSNLEVASSPSGEVKFYLSYDLASKRPDFHVPTLEAFLKSVEDKCLRSPKTSDPYIPMLDLMKEMCECFLECGTESKSQSPQPMDVAPAIDPVIKPLAVDGPLNGSAHYQTRARVSQAQKQAVPPPGDDVNHEQQPKKIDTRDEILTNGKKQENCSEETNILGLEVVQQPQMALEITGSPAVVDIAKGQEKVVITLVNEVNDELPPSFFYIPQNAAFQNAYVNISLARIGDNHSCGACSGDCLSLSLPCACAHETGGEYAYTTDGLVKEELLKESISMNRDPKKHCQFFCKECPLERSKCEDTIESCKGHLVRKFIKECWWKCGCNKQCGNRVVQRGISRSLQVFMAPGGKGWGLRTLEDLPKGAFVCEYVGEVLTNAELFERVSRTPKGEKHSYPVLLDADWCAEGVLKDEEALCLDATYYGNVARFINHRCYDSNLVEIPVEVETPDHHYYRLAFFTTRKVKAMEELTWDYGIDFDDHEHPIKAFQCQCGSKYCRNIKRSRSRSRR